MADKKTTSTKSTASSDDVTVLSSDAKFSTYKENKSDDLAPDAGRHVIQELGKPSK